MTQYDDVVEQQRIKAAAEEWGKKINNIHVFNSDNTNVWYDEREGD